MTASKVSSFEYRNNWKYELRQPHQHQLHFVLPGTGGQSKNASDNGQPLIKIETENGAGKCVAIHFETGYQWDGPSGPTIDTCNAMRASLVHDGLYQAIREGWLEQRARKRADREFHRILKKDGMIFWRRWLWYWGVRLFAANAAQKPRSSRPSK